MKVKLFRRHGQIWVRADPDQPTSAGQLFKHCAGADEVLYDYYRDSIRDILFCHGVDMVVLEDEPGDILEDAP